MGMRAWMVMALAVMTAQAEIDGYKIYLAKCSMCHNEMTTTAQVKAKFQTMKAPPIMEVSNQLKAMIGYNGNDEEVKRQLVLTFMRDYIFNPDIDKSMCNLGAIDQFGVMPSQKGKLTQEELVAVSEWLYDHFEGKEFQ